MNKRTPKQELRLAQRAHKNAVDRIRAAQANLDFAARRLRIAENAIWGHW